MKSTDPEAIRKDYLHSFDSAQEGLKSLNYDSKVMFLSEKEYSVKIESSISNGEFVMNQIKTLKKNPSVSEFGKKVIESLEKKKKFLLFPVKYTPKETSSPLEFPTKRLEENESESDDELAVSFMKKTKVSLNIPKEPYFDPFFFSLGLKPVIWKNGIEEKLCGRSGYLRIKKKKKRHFLLYFSRFTSEYGKQNENLNGPFIFEVYLYSTSLKKKVTESALFYQGERAKSSKWMCQMYIPVESYQNLKLIIIQRGPFLGKEMTTKFIQKLLSGEKLTEKESKNIKQLIMKNTKQINKIFSYSVLPFTDSNKKLILKGVKGGKFIVDNRKSNKNLDFFHSKSDSDKSFYAEMRIKVREIDGKDVEYKSERMVMIKNGKEFFQPVLSAFIEKKMIQNFIFLHPKKLPDYGHSSKKLKNSMRIIKLRFRSKVLPTEILLEKNILAKDFLNTEIKMRLPNGTNNLKDYYVQVSFHFINKNLKLTNDNDLKDLYFDVVDESYGNVLSNVVTLENGMMIEINPLSNLVPKDKYISTFFKYPLQVVRHLQKSFVLDPNNFLSHFSIIMNKLIVDFYNSKKEKKNLIAALVKCIRIISKNDPDNFSYRNPNVSEWLVLDSEIPNNLHLLLMRELIDFFQGEKQVIPLMIGVYSWVFFDLIIKSIFFSYENKTIEKGFKSLKLTINFVRTMIVWVKKGQDCEIENPKRWKTVHYLSNNLAMFIRDLLRCPDEVIEKGEVLLFIETFLKQITNNKIILSFVDILIEDANIIELSLPSVLYMGGNLQSDDFFSLYYGGILLEVCSKNFIGEYRSSYFSIVNRIVMKLSRRKEVLGEKNWMFFYPYIKDVLLKIEKLKKEWENELLNGMKKSVLYYQKRELFFTLLILLSHMDKNYYFGKTTIFFVRSVIQFLKEVVLFFMKEEPKELSNDELVEIDLYLNPPQKPKQEPIKSTPIKSVKTEELQPIKKDNTKTKKMGRAFASVAGLNIGLESMGLGSHGFASNSKKDGEKKSNQLKEVIKVLKTKSSDIWLSKTKKIVLDHVVSIFNAYITVTSENEGEKNMPEDTELAFDLLVLLLKYYDEKVILLEIIQNLFWNKRFEGSPYHENFVRKLVWAIFQNTHKNPNLCVNVFYQLLKFWVEEAEFNTTKNISIDSTSELVSMNWISENLPLLAEIDRDERQDIEIIKNRNKALLNSLDKVFKLFEKIKTYRENGDTVRIQKHLVQLAIFNESKQMAMTWCRELSEFLYSKKMFIESVMVEVFHAILLCDKEKDKSILNDLKSCFPTFDSLETKLLSEKETSKGNYEKLAVLLEMKIIPKLLELKNTFIEYSVTLTHVICEIQKVNKNYASLSKQHLTLSQLYSHMANELIDDRDFGTYYLITKISYGRKFTQRVYKLKNFARLSDCMKFIRETFGKKFGEKNLVMESNNYMHVLTEKKLQENKEKVYFLIQALEPATIYKNDNFKTWVGINKFTYENRKVYENIESKEDIEKVGKVQVFITTQYKFPFFCGWSDVVDEKLVDISPIENAVLLVKKKNETLRSLLHEEVSLSTLQMVLGGCLIPQVQEGLLPIIRTFFDNPKYFGENVDILREEITEFLVLALKCMNLHKKIIKLPPHAILHEEYLKGFSLIFVLVFYTKKVESCGYLAGVYLNFVKTNKLKMSDENLRKKSYSLKAFLRECSILFNRDEELEKDLSESDFDSIEVNKKLLIEKTNDSDYDSDYDEDNSDIDRKLGVESLQRENDDFLSESERENDNLSSSEEKEGESNQDDDDDIQEDDIDFSSDEETKKNYSSEENTEKNFESDNESGLELSVNTENFVEKKTEEIKKEEIVKEKNNIEENTKKEENLLKKKFQYNEDDMVIYKRKVTQKVEDDFTLSDDYDENPGEISEEIHDYDEKPTLGETRFFSQEDLLLSDEEEENDISETERERLKREKLREERRRKRKERLKRTDNK